MTIGHFGSLASTRNLAVFLEALGRLLRKRPELAKIIRLEFYGSAVDPVSADAVAQFPFPGIVRPFGRLERDPVTGLSGRDRVLRRMQTVDALLLLHGTGTACEEYIPSKLYEYFWSERRSSDWCGATRSSIASCVTRDTGRCRRMTSRRPPPRWRN